MRLDLGGARGPDLLLDPLGEQRQLVLPDGRPWQALRTPETIFGRLNGSVTPDRLTTVRLAVSTVLKRRPHCGQTRRRRMAQPSSVLRESTTRESAERQNGQFIDLRPPLSVDDGRPPVDDTRSACGGGWGLHVDGLQRCNY